MRSLRYFLLEWGSPTFWAIMQIVTSVAYYGFLTLSLYTMILSYFPNMTKEQSVTLVFVGLFGYIVGDDRKTK